MSAKKFAHWPSRDHAWHQSSTGHCPKQGGHQQARHSSSSFVHWLRKTLAIKPCVQELLAQSVAASTVLCTNTYGCQAHCKRGRGEFLELTHTGLWDQQHSTFLSISRSGDISDARLIRSLTSKRDNGTRSASQRMKLRWGNRKTAASSHEVISSVLIAILHGQSARYLAKTKILSWWKWIIPLDYHPRLVRIIVFTHPLHWPISSSSIINTTLPYWLHGFKLVLTCRNQLIN